MNEYLFSYGTLQTERVQLELFGRLLAGSKDVLSAYYLQQVEISDESFLARGEQKNQLTAVPSNNQNDTIEGTVLEVTTAELLLADKYEPNGYTRVKITLNSGKQAWIYLLNLYVA